jgi:hypothetical protein
MMAKAARKKIDKLDTAEIAGPLRNRIVASGEENPEKLLANPKNWRTHSADQESAVEGLLEEVGWVSNVIVNRKSGRLIDGHLRVALAKRRKEKKIPVVYVDLSDKEEEIVLATLDPLGDLAGIDAKRLETLLGELDPASVALKAMIADLEAELGIGKDEETDVEVLLDQAVQLEPAREYIVVMCDGEEDWERLREVLELRTVRRGGYKKGSPFDANGTERVIRARRLLNHLEGK